jgi:hypothetical protein
VQTPERSNRLLVSSYVTENANSQV